MAQTRQRKEQIEVTHLFPSGRLTLETGVPISTSDQSDKTTLYFTPYKGNIIQLYNDTDSRWDIHEFTELSLDISGFTASKPYDIFIYDNAGTLTLSGTVWTDATTRATALTTQDGVYVKSGATNYRYLGTIYMDADQKCDDSISKRFVWNYYNRVIKSLFCYDTTNTWSYTTTTWRAVNNSSTYGTGRFGCVIGVSEDIISVKNKSFAYNSSTTRVAGGVGINSTNSNSAQIYGFVVNSNHRTSMSIYEGLLPEGFNYIQRLEISQANGTTSWIGDYGNVAINMQTGMTGMIKL